MGGSSSSTGNHTIVLSSIWFMCLKVGIFLVPWKWWVWTMGFLHQLDSLAPINQLRHVMNLWTQSPALTIVTLHWSLKVPSWLLRRLHEMGYLFLRIWDPQNFSRKPMYFGAFEHSHNLQNLLASRFHRNDPEAAVECQRQPTLDDYRREFLENSWNNHDQYM